MRMNQRPQHTYETENERKRNLNEGSQVPRPNILSLFDANDSLILYFPAMYRDFRNDEN